MSTDTVRSLHSRPLADAVAPARATHRATINEVVEWGLAHGLPLDADVVAFGRAARAEGSMWHVSIEDFVFVGRIDAHGRTPELALYRHRRRPRGELVVAATGQPFWFTPDDRRRAGLRWSPITVSASAWRSGIAGARRPHAYDWQEVDDEWLAHLDRRPGEGEE